MFHFDGASGLLLQSLPVGMLLAGCLAFALTALFTPAMIRIAHLCSLVDAPDGHRKLQQRAVPLGGGVAIQAAVFLSLLVMWVFHSGVHQALNSHFRFTWGLLAAVAAVGLVGLADDLLEIRGRQKLIGQILSIAFIVFGGLVIRKITILNWEYELGAFAIPFTIVWLVGAINALNLIDGLDGLAGSVSLIMATTLGILAASTGRVQEAVVAWALAGAVGGFLIYNWNPARIFLGDAGSMTIGLILGVLAIRVSMKEATTVGLAVPVVLWSIMFFDVGMAILRRRLTGQSVYTTDRSHFHHVLQRHGYSVRQAVCIIAGACLLCCLGVVASISLQQEWVSIGSATMVLAGIVASGLFGRTELGLLLRWSISFSSSLCRLPGRLPKHTRPQASPFHGQRDWEPLWQELIAYAERFDLCDLQLNVSAPILGEEYHAQWRRKTCAAPRELWKSEIPLHVGSMTVGRLTVSGERQNRSGVECVIDVIDGLKPFQMQMELLLEDSLTSGIPVGKQTMQSDGADSQSLPPEQSISHTKKAVITGFEGAGVS